MRRCCTLQEASHHAKTGDWQSCLALCRDILDQVPEIISANYLAGIASIQLGIQDDAIAFLRASIEQYESDDNKLSMLCDLLVVSDRAEEALPYLERLLALAPGPDVLNRLGAIMPMRGVSARPSYGFANRWRLSLRIISRAPVSIRFCELPANGATNSISFRKTSIN